LLAFGTAAGDRDRVKPNESPIIVVLGAPNDEEGRLLPAAAGRALLALGEWQKDPRSRLLLTGGFGSHFNNTARPHFEYLAAFLTSRGVPPAAILGGVASESTLTDAAKSAEFLREHPGPLHLKVVTSDFHVARARLIFERAFPHAASLEMVGAPSGLPAAELDRARQHEAEAIRKLTGGDDW
jgi:uncharacterized SAM-binding protein YcdF (DUF218 family)